MLFWGRCAPSRKATSGAEKLVLQALQVQRTGVCREVPGVGNGPRYRSRELEVVGGKIRVNQQEDG
jgi:hypothetical protein